MLLSNVCSFFVLPPSLCKPLCMPSAFPSTLPLPYLCLHRPSPMIMASMVLYSKNLLPPSPGASSSHLRLPRPPTSLCSHLPVLTPPCAHTSPVLTPPLFSLRFANPSLARTALCSIRFAHVHSFRPTRSFLRTRPCVVHRACAPASLRLAPPRPVSLRLAPPRSASLRLL